MSAIFHAVWIWKQEIALGGFQTMTGLLCRSRDRAGLTFFIFFGSGGVGCVGGGQIFWDLSEKPNPSSEPCSQTVEMISVAHHCKQPRLRKKKHFNASSHNVLLQFSLPAHPFLILWLCKKKKRLDWGGGCVQVPSARLFNNVPKQGSVDEGTYPCVPVCVSRPSVSHLKCSQELWWNGCRNNKEAFRGALVQVYTPCPCKATKQGDESSCDVICTCCRGRKSNLKLSKSQSILIIFNTLNEE